MPHTRIDALSQTASLLPDCGIAAGTEVLTMDGCLPVEFLTPGDRLMTRSGIRRLKAVEMTRITNAQVVRVTEGVLGHGRPGGQVVMLATQPVLIRDWRARALYGVDQAMVAAGRLADGTYIRAETLAEVRMFTLRLEDDAVIYAQGLELACPAVVAA